MGEEGGQSHIRRLELGNHMLVDCWRAGPILILMPTGPARFESYVPPGPPSFLVAGEMVQALLGHKIQKGGMPRWGIRFKMAAAPVGHKIQKYVKTTVKTV